MEVTGVEAVLKHRCDGTLGLGAILHPFSVWAFQGEGGLPEPEGASGDGGLAICIVNLQVECSTQVCAYILFLKGGLNGDSHLQQEVAPCTPSEERGTVLSRLDGLASDTAILSLLILFLALLVLTKMTSTAFNQYIFIKCYYEPIVDTGDSILSITEFTA